MPNFTESEFTVRRTAIQNAYSEAYSAAKNFTYDNNWPENWREVEFEKLTTAAKIRDEALTKLEAEYGDTAQDDFFAEAGLN